MFDLTLQPVSTQLTAVGEAIADLQQNAVHRIEFDSLRDSVVGVQQHAVQSNDRIGKLESEIEKLKEQLKRVNVSNHSSPDPGYRRIAFENLPLSKSYEQRVEFMKSFMLTHFPNVVFGD